jgi:integrase
VSLKNLGEHFGTMMLDQIKGAALSDFETKRRGDGVTNGTIRRDLACLSSLMTSATDWEWIDDGANPVPSYLRRRAKRGLKEAPARTRYLTEEEEARPAGPRDAQRARCHHPGDRHRAAIERTVRAPVAQIDFARGIIATTTKTKSGRARHVPLTPVPHNSRHSPRRLDTPYVLVNPDTGTRYVNMSKGLEAARRRSATAAVWHDLRRTAGCRWLQRDGKTMAEVSMLLGHSSVP